MRAAQESVQVYSWGLCYASACAPAEVEAADVEAAVNLSHPTGITSQWKIADVAFTTGEPNPHACEQAAGRRHWLLVC